MDCIFFAALVAATASGANADVSPFGAHYGLDEAAAIVDRLHETPWRKHSVELVDVFQHAIGPNAAQVPVLTGGDAREIADAHESDPRSEPLDLFPQPRNRKE